jgi:peptidoglycan/LPS O-acetylase OafA/YrhL
MVSNRTELFLAQRVGSHGLAVALQAVLGISISMGVAYLSYQLFERRFLDLKPRFAP